MQAFLRAATMCEHDQMKCAALCQEIYITSQHARCPVGCLVSEVFLARVKKQDDLHEQRPWRKAINHTDSPTADWGVRCVRSKYLQCIYVNRGFKTKTGEVAVRCSASSPVMQCPVPYTLHASRLSVMSAAMHV